jgi:tetratricopeptide (TPR) repeat protein
MLTKDAGLTGGIMSLGKRYNFLAGFCVFLLLSCATTPMGTNSWLDTPVHHVNNGNTLLKSGKIDDALREFNRARELDPNYSSAYVGLSLVYGLKGDDETSAAYLKKAVDLLKEARKK